MKEPAMDSRLYGWLFDFFFQYWEPWPQVSVSELGLDFVRTTAMGPKNHPDNRWQSFPPF
jgi:hypothetical protein